jgi:hypothetical protein
MLYDKKWDEVDEASQAILDAVNYLETHGWCQRSFFKGKEACMLGALHMATLYKSREDEFVKLGMVSNVSSTYTEAGNRIWRYLISKGELTKDEFVGVYNDMPDRTFEQIKETMLTVAYSKEISNVG